MMAEGRRRTLVATGVLVAVLASAPLSGQSPGDDTLKVLVRTMADAQTAYDQKALDAVLATDFVEVSPVGDVDARDKVLGFYAPELKPPADKATVKIALNDFVIRSYGQFAIVVVRMDYEMTADGKALPPRSMRATVTCRMERGAWKIASAQYTGIRTAGR